MNIDKFKFYAVLKNEDAMPYIQAEGDKGFIVAADGLGGSGSFVHQLSEKATSKLRSLLDSMLPEYEPEIDTDKEFKDWITNLIEPMQDGKPDTSALWGSRVVIARLVNYLRIHSNVNFADEIVRDKIVKYIYDGMGEIIDEFKLKTGDLSGQLTLPTTLVGIKYAVNADNSIHADVFWAGDSRAYALIPGKGLKLLSQDDEDNSGAIVNLFAFKKDQKVPTKLNYKSYTLPAKSCMFVCSDGFFDPYDPVDNLGVEAVLLESITKATSFDDFRQKWYKNYEPIEQDDCTVAFLAFGLDSFDELKNMYAERSEKVVNALNEYMGSKKVIPIIKGEADDPRESIVNRAKSRMPEIANRIAAECMANPRSADITVTPAIKEIFARSKVECRERSDAKIANKKKELVAQLVQALLNSPSNIEKIFNTQGDMLQSLEPLVTAARDVADKQSRYDDAKIALESIRADCGNIQRQRDELKDAIVKRKIEVDKARVKIETFLSLCDELLNGWIKPNCSFNSDSVKKLQDVKFQYQREYNIVTSAIKMLDDLINNLDNNKVSQKSDKGYSRDKELLEKAQKLCEKYGKALYAIKEAESAIKVTLSSLQQSMDAYQNKVKVFAKDNMDFYIDRPDEHFTEQIATRVKEKCSAEVEELTAELLASKIENYFDSDVAAFDEIIRNFIASKTATVIDPIFNASRLALCRNYQSFDQEKVKRLISTVDALMKGYEEYLAMPTPPAQPTDPTGAAKPTQPKDETGAGDPTDPTGK